MGNPTKGASFRQNLKVRSVHDQVSRNGLREGHSASFRMVISVKNFVKTPSNCVPKGLQKRLSTPTYPQEKKVLQTLHLPG